MGSLRIQPKLTQTRPTQRDTGRQASLSRLAKGRIIERNAEASQDSPCALLSHFPLVPLVVTLRTGQCTIKELFTVPEPGRLLQTLQTLIQG